MSWRQLLVFLPLFIFISACQEGTVAEEEVVEDTSNTLFEDPPQWSKEVIWYQIFVERFRNGDPSNDPTKEDIIGTYPGFVPASWEVTSWTQDWYEEDPYFAEVKGQPDPFGNPIGSFSQMAQLRRYGGDLQGVLDKLDYLEDLGVTAIYFNPLNDAPSLHKYDARHWRHIDRNFGPSPKEDVAIMAAEKADDPSTWQLTGADKMFVQVLEECHKRGMKVILDFSWNHTGNTFWAWQDILEKGKESAYSDWYWIKQFDDPSTPENEFEYRGWFGVKELPEIQETQFIDHSKKVEAFEGNLVSEAAKQHIFNVTKRWLDPNGDGDPTDGVDGFRLDVAAEVPLGFWREYRKVVRDLNPDAYLLGEVWWEEWPDHLLDPEPFLKGDVFDAPMNYRWYRSARHFFNDSPDVLPVSVFVDSLESYAGNLRKQNNYAMMNLTASHDSPRVATSLFNKNKYKFNCSPFAGTGYRVDKPDAATREVLKLLLVQQFTFVGSPQIWAGDEMGMWGGDDPDTRKPLIWKDYDFAPEKVDPLGEEEWNDEVKFDQGLFDYYKQMIQIRKDHQLLSTGELDYILIDDERRLLAYSRYDEDEEIIVIFNLSEEGQEVVVDKKPNQDYEDILGGLSPEVVDQKLKINLGPRSTAILTSGR